MSLLGKILVFVNLGLSFLMAGWALSVYVNRIDFSNAPAKGDQPAGEMLGRKARVEEQKVTRPLLINTVVESGLILKRRKQLEARIEELEKVGVAADK